MREMNCEDTEAGVERFIAMQRWSCLSAAQRWYEDSETGQQRRTGSLSLLKGAWCDKGEPGYVLLYSYQRPVHVLLSAGLWKCSAASIQVGCRQLHYLLPGCVWFHHHGNICQSIKWKMWCCDGFSERTLINWTAIPLTSLCVCVGVGSGTCDCHEHSRVPLQAGLRRFIAADELLTSLSPRFLSGAWPTHCTAFICCQKYHKRGGLQGLPKCKYKRKVWLIM